MTEMHQQALASIYRQVLQRLVNAHGEAQRQAMLRLAESIGCRYPRLDQARLVVLCAGERDGLLTLALVRAAQLLLAEAQGHTFRLRVVVPLLPGLTTVDHGNVARACAALFLHEDDRVEVMAADQRALEPYERIRPGTVGRGATGRALLRTAHAARTSKAGPAARYCAANAARLLCRALEGGGQLNVWVTAQPNAQLLHQCARARRVLRQAGRLAAGERHPTSGWLHRLAELAPGAPEHGFAQTRIYTPLNLQAFLPASPKVRWEQAMHCLGMQIDPFSLRRDALDCADYLLGAHVAALAALYIKGDDVATGLVQWLRPRFERLRREGISVRKLAGLRASCLGERAIDSQAHRLRLHSEERYGLNEEQLCCLIFQPFANKGAGLKAFLEHCHPDRVQREPQLRLALEGRITTAEAGSWLRRVSGLPLPVLRQLYADIGHLDIGNGPASKALRLPCGCSEAPQPLRPSDECSQGQSTKGAGHG